jgi:hypothetical protein
MYKEEVPQPPLIKKIEDIFMIPTSKKKIQPVSRVMCPATFNKKID